MERAELRPVGTVKNNFKRNPKRKDWSAIFSKILIKPEFSRCLEGIEKYSHLVVLYWMHKADNKKTTAGAFAHRTSARPNPVGLTIVELISREGEVLTVKRLDAFDGTPVIDIKPYSGHPKDLIMDFRSPDKFPINFQS